MRAIVESGGIWPGGGSGPDGRRLAVASQLVSGVAVLVVGAGAPATPGGCGIAAEDALSTGRMGRFVPHPASANTSAVTRTAAFTSTP
jgi:hypothetical protein